MGRPKLYNTDEERLAAGRERSAQYYALYVGNTSSLTRLEFIQRLRKRVSICEKRRNKYEEKQGEERANEPKWKTEKKGKAEETGLKEGNEGKKARNIEKRSEGGRRRAPMVTDEEQKLKNRLKSARYYQRKKSEI